MTKSTKLTKKLRLATETLRTLDQTELLDVAGGLSYECTQAPNLTKDNLCAYSALAQCQSLTVALTA